MELDKQGGRRLRVWVGIDVGKGHHWASAVDETGAQVWSRKVGNEEADILAAIGAALELTETVSWAVDITSGPAGLLLALLAGRGQQVRYVPGRTVNTVSAGYRGEAKTDAKDAFVIADVSRLRGDFVPVRVPAELVAELGLLTGHRADLVAGLISTGRIRLAVSSGPRLSWVVDGGRPRARGRVSGSG